MTDLKRRILFGVELELWKMKIMSQPKYNLHIKTPPPPPNITKSTNFKAIKINEMHLFTKI